MVFIIYITIVVAIIFLICFFIFRIGIYFIEKIFKKNWSRKILKSSISAVLLSALMISFLLFYNPAKNFKTASIEKVKNSFKITVKGKRNLMVHDPISLLKGGTYIDSSTLILPRETGIIRGSELQEFTGYQVINNNAITIHKTELEINIITYNSDDHKKKPSLWNGKYKLIRKNY